MSFIKSIRKINTIKHLSQTNLGTGPINPSLKNNKNKLNQQINSKLLSSNVNSIKNHLIFDPLLKKVHKARKTMTILSKKSLSKDDNIDITGDQDVFFGKKFILFNQCSDYLFLIFYRHTTRQNCFCIRNITLD